MRFSIAVIFIAVSSVASPVAAETADALDLIEKCEIAMKYDGNIESFAIPLSQMTGLDLTPENRFRGMDCLKRQFGFQFYFNNETNGFISDKDDMEKTRPAREAAQKLKDELEKQRNAENELRKIQLVAEEERQKRISTNKEELHRRIWEACYDSLRTDTLQALTQPICQTIFIENGFDRR